MRETVSRQAEVAIAKKTEEAVGLLLLVKPLFKRAGKLTAAEQEMMTDTIRRANHLLSEATTFYWQQLQEPKDMVRAS